jgi:hypothetical protein
MGFEKALRAWKSLMKQGGYIVVSDIAWFEKDPPAELMQFWEKEGCMPLTEEEKKEQLKKAGLRLVATFRLPEEGWWKHYYVPLLARVKDLRKTYGTDPALAAILDSYEHEAEIYRKYRRYYGYIFFVMQNI